jgi:hypothetical protein
MSTESLRKARKNVAFLEGAALPTAEETTLRQSVESSKKMRSMRKKLRHDHKATATRISP